MDEKIIFCPFFMQSNGLYIRVIDERLFKTTKEVTALTRDIDYIVDKFSDDIYRAALAVTGSVHEAEDIVSEENDDKSIQRPAKVGRQTSACRK